jgi:nucleoredoxin
MANVWTQIFGEHLMTKKGDVDTNEVLYNKKVVGVYFSAHWCPPCRRFTPELATMYEDMIEMHPDFEIVFVSYDENTEYFEEYYGEMPFTAVPFEKNELREQMGQKYEVNGIPSLVFLNHKGDVITKEGHQLVTDTKGDFEKIWSNLICGQIAPFS